MSLNVGLTSEDKFSSIVGFSGKIINQNDLKQRIKNLTDVFLIHGELPGAGVFLFSAVHAPLRHSRTQSQGNIFCI